MASAISRARTAYMTNPSDARLRAYLTLKAKAGIFDVRMCGFYKVDPKVNKGCKKAICRAFAAGLVPTSTRGGAHALGSHHYSGCAVDFGLRGSLVGTATGNQRLATFQRKEFWRRKAGKIAPVELIGPLNHFTVLRGNIATLAEGTALEQAHDNHVHEAYTA